MTTSLDIPLGKGGELGTFGFDTFFEWYAAQKQLTGSGANIQEIDYTLRYSYEFKPIATKATVGWTAFVYPNVRGVGDNDRTFEVFFSFEHNDAWMWRWLGYQGDDPILNPSLFVAYDYKIANGVWIELGVNHPFALTEDLTFTPGMLLAIDAGWLGPTLGTDDHDTRFAYTQLGMDLTYDLTKALHLPDWAGSVALSGQLYFNCTTDSAAKTGIQDEFWGGMAVSWSW